MKECIRNLFKMNKCIRNCFKIKECIRNGLKVGNAVFVKNRKLEWSENTNIKRSMALGGVSQGAKALGTGVDLDSIASMFDDMITNTGHSELDIGDGRLLRIQQSHRSLMGSIQGMGGQTHTGAMHGIPMPLSNGNTIVVTH